MKKRFPLLIYDSIGVRIQQAIFPFFLFGALGILLNTFYPVGDLLQIGSIVVGTGSLIGLLLVQAWIRQSAVLVEKDHIIIQEPYRRTKLFLTEIHRIEPERLSDRYSSNNLNLFFLSLIRKRYREFGVVLRLKREHSRYSAAGGGILGFRKMVYPDSRLIFLWVSDWVSLHRALEAHRTEIAEYPGPHKVPNRPMVSRPLGKIIGPEGAPLIVVGLENETLHKQLQQILLQDYRMIGTTSGTETLRLIRDLDPSLVIISEHLSKLNGYQLMLTLTKSERLKHLPVFFVSKTLLPAALDAGAKDVLLRPFNPDDVLARVQTWLEINKNIRALKQANYKLEDMALEQKAELLRRGELANFLPNKVAENVLSGELMDRRTRLRKMTVTVLFVDLVDFTSLAGRLEPDVLSALINEFLNEMASAAIMHHGTIDKFIGDEVMVLFGAPDRMTEEDQVRHAVEAALEMRDRIDSLSARWVSRIGQELQVRIGFNSGIGTAGVFGQKGLQSYTVVGPVVNVAARLRAAAAPGEILCSRHSFIHVQRIAKGESRGFLNLKGVKEPIEGVAIADLDWLLVE